MTPFEGNKAGYTAKDAPSTRLKITRDGPTDLRTDGRTDGRTDTPSYRDASAHLKNQRKIKMTEWNWNRNSFFQGGGEKKTCCSAVPLIGHQHSNGSFEVGRAAAPKAALSCRTRRKSLHWSASVSPPIQNPTVAGWWSLGRQTDDHTEILSRAKVYRHGFLVVSCSKLIKKQKQKKILELDQICDSMVQTRIFYLKPFGNDNQNKTTPLIKKC